MPLNIPYHQDLAIGQIVTEEKIHNLMRISALKAPADIAKDQLDALISLRRSIEMTIRELENMNIDTTGLAQERHNIDARIKAATETFQSVKDEVEKAVQPFQSATEPCHYAIETPIDYQQSQIQQSQLSADSLRLNCEYIPMPDNENSIASHSLAVSSFLNETLAFLGDPFYPKLHSMIQSHSDAAASGQSIAGTLVISVSCVQKGAITIAPLVLDPAKAIRAWNTIFPEKKIPTDNEAGLAKMASQIADDREEASFKLITGATYASCFVGMIHVTKEPGALTTEALRSIAQTIELQFKASSWTGYENRIRGIDSDFFGYNKTSLDLLPETTHCSIISLGATSSAKSNQMKELIRQAEHAQASLITRAEQTLIENVEEKVADTHTMIKAMQEYTALCLENGNGVPVSYYLKPFTQSQLAQLWFRKMS